MSRPEADPDSLARPDQAVGEIKKKDYRPEKAPKWELGTTTDNEGRFALAGLPDGLQKVRVIILAPGYERFEAVASIPAGTSASVGYSLTRLPDNPYRTVVENDVAGLGADDRGGVEDNTMDLF